MYSKEEQIKRAGYLRESIEMLKQSEILYEDRLEETRTELIERETMLNKILEGVDLNV